MITVSATLQPLDLLNRELGLYARLAGKTAEEVLEKKGRDLGIQLYRGFSDTKYGGPGRPRRGIAMADARARRSSGRGTVVRSILLSRYSSARLSLTKSIREAGQARRNAKRLGARAGLGLYRAAAQAGLRDRKLRSRLWNAVVGEEIALRQSGIGALAASFLLFRNRDNSQGRTQRRNRTGHTAGYIERGPGYFRIVGVTPALTAVDSRYGIVAGAVAAVRADMAPYIRRKLVEGLGSFRTLSPR